MQLKLTIDGPDFARFYRDMTKGLPTLGSRFKSSENRDTGQKNSSNGGGFVKKNNSHSHAGKPKKKTCQTVHW